MPTLGTQTISSSYAQLIKTFGTGGLDGALQVVTDGDNTSSALSLSTTGVKSTGSFAVDGASTLTGAVTFGSNITASTGTATIGTLSAGTATISTATIPLQLGAITFGSNITASTGTATIGTLFASGPATFGTSITASTGTATLGTIASTTINNTGLGTTGTLQVGASGPKLTAVSFGTAAFTSATVQAHNVPDTTTGTFGLTGCALGDIVFGSINTLGAATGTICLAVSFYPQTTDVARYSIINKGATAGTISAGTIFATAMRFTA